MPCASTDRELCHWHCHISIPPSIPPAARLALTKADLPSLLPSTPRDRSGMGTAEFTPDGIGAIGSYRSPAVPGTFRQCVVGTGAPSVGQ